MGLYENWDSMRSVDRFRCDKTVSEQNNMVEKHLPDRHGDHNRHAVKQRVLKNPYSATPLQVFGPI